MIISLILKVAYFCLAAYLANMSPVIIDKIGLFKFLKVPIDSGRELWGRPILGKGKTWRGILTGVIVAIAVAGVQKLLFQYPQIQAISIVDFNEVNFLLFGFLAGLGAMVGDLIKSFIKRRINIASGKSWPIADQLDFILGFILFTYWLVYPSLEIIAVACLLTLVLHPLTNIIGYLLKIKKVWW